MKREMHTHTEKRIINIILVKEIRYKIAYTVLFYLHEVQVLENSTNSDRDQNNHYFLISSC